MSFRSFLEDLRADGVLEETHEHVSTEYELAMRATGRGPMLFHNADGHVCCINILGSRELLARALRMDAKNLARDLSAVGFDGHVREVDSSHFQENILETDLMRLPVLRHFRGDGGRYITSGIVVSRLDDRINACVHRLMVLDRKRLAARLVPGRHTHQMYSRAIETGRRLPVAIAIGVDPVVLIAASTRVPENKEFEYASALRGDVVEVVTLENGVPVPHAEIVLEGYLTEKRAPEGPFVDITGTMDIVREEPVIEITRIMMRDDAIYHALLPAGGEHRMLMGVPYEPLIYREASKVVRVRNVLLTEGGCTYFHAVVQIEKQEEEDGLKAIQAAMAAHGSLKHVLVVDTDIDIHDPRELEYAIATRVRGDQDIYMYPNVRGSTLDPRSVDGMTTKVGVDATAKLDRLWKFRRVVRPW